MKIILFSTFLFLSSFASNGEGNKITSFSTNSTGFSLTFEVVPGDCTVTITGVCRSVSFTAGNCSDARSGAIAAYAAQCSVQ